jgi:glycerophosphoryl diester phosphodiesterase
VTRHAPRADTPVNEPADMERVLDLGVDGIITDYPDRARSILAKRGVPVD